MKIDTKIDDFINFIIEAEIIKFGSFKTKSGRISPYFFNTGLFNTGFLIKKLSAFYACKIIESNIKFDVLFGSAYKGIPLATSTAIALSQIRKEKSVNFSFNRKEEKDHGEKGNIIGSELKGNVLIIDDVITSGKSIYEAINIISNSKGFPVGVIVAMDRMEFSEKNNKYCFSSSQEITNNFSLPVISLVSIKEIFGFITRRGKFREHHERIRKYMNEYCIL